MQSQVSYVVAQNVVRRISTCGPTSLHFDWVMITQTVTNSWFGEQKMFMNYVQCVCSHKKIMVLYVSATNRCSNGDDGFCLGDYEFANESFGPDKCSVISV